MGKKKTKKRECQPKKGLKAKQIPDNPPKPNSNTDSASEKENIFVPGLVASGLREPDLPLESANYLGAIPKAVQCPIVDSTQTKLPVSQKGLNTYFLDKYPQSQNNLNDFDSTGSNLPLAKRLNKVECPIDPVCGVAKFYNDEFDAFYKYFVAIHKPSKFRVINQIIESVQLLPDTAHCTLAECSEDFLGRTSIINFISPPVIGTNKSIEYAHPSLKLTETERKGRQLVATTTLVRNTVLINEKPTVVQVQPRCSCDKELKELYECHHCGFRVTHYYSCPQCYLVAFCSSNCRIAALQNYHKYECEGFQRHFWDSKHTDYSYLAFRMILYGSQYGFHHQVNKKNKKWGRAPNCNNYPFIYKLDSKFDHIPVMIVYEVLRKATKTLIYLMTRTDFFDKMAVSIFTIGGLFVKHFFQAKMNCTYIRYRSITYEDSFRLGSLRAKAICPTIAMLNHSCKPNAVVIGCEDRVVVKSLRDIQPNEEITICYYPVNPALSLEDRHTIMNNFLYFTTPCECPFCQTQVVMEACGYLCWPCASQSDHPQFYNVTQTRFNCPICMTFEGHYNDFEHLCESLLSDFAQMSQNVIMRDILLAGNAPGYSPFLVLHVANKLLGDMTNAVGDEMFYVLALGNMMFRWYEKLFPSTCEFLMELKIIYYLNIINPDFDVLRITNDWQRKTVEDLLFEVGKALIDLLVYLPREVVTDYESLVVPQIKAVLRQDFYKMKGNGDKEKWRLR